MTTRNRLLFIALLGLAATGGRGEEAGRAGRTAPDQPGLAAGASPIFPAPPKRRFDERVTFHEVDPFLPEKPRKKSGEPELKPEPRSQPRAPRPLDPRTDAPRRPPPEPPTHEEIQKALRSKNWLDPTKFEDSGDKEERKRLDEAMGLAPEGDEDSSSPNGDGDTPGGKPATFGDFFDKAREEALALARVESGEELPDEEEQTRLKEEQEKKSAAEEREDKRAQRQQSDAGVGAAFSPVEAGRAAETANPSTPDAAAAARAGDPLAPSFTPVLSSPQPSRPTPGRELSAALGRTNEEPAATRFSAVPDSFSPGLAREIEAPRAISAETVTGSFRQMDLRDYRDTRVSDSGRATADARAPQDEGSPFRDNMSPALGRTGNLGGGFMPATFAGSDTGGMSPRRTTIAPPAGTGFQSGFSALRSSAILPPSVGNAEPARADRWEKDRMKSQLLGESPSSGFGARKP